MMYNADSRKKRKHGVTGRTDDESDPKKHDGRQQKKPRYEVSVHHDQPTFPSGQVQTGVRGSSLPEASQSFIPQYQRSASTSKPGQERVIPPLPPLPEGQLANDVFTHASMDAVRNYERYEFLGDAYLELMAVRLIYDRHPTHTPKHMSQLREKLVCNNTLNHFASLYNFADRINSQGVQKAGSDKVVADVFEAYIAALVLSDPVKGFAAAEKWMAELWTPLLSEKGSFGSPATSSGVDIEAKDKVNRLLWCKPVKIEYRNRGLSSADKKTLKGQNIAQMTRVSLYITWEGEDEVEIASAVGVGRKEAGLKAAEAALAAQDRPLVRGLAQRKVQHEEARRAKQQL